MHTSLKSNYFTKEQEQTARFAKALGHPVRIAILQLLSSPACCFHRDMADELKDAGLIQGNITPQQLQIPHLY